MTAQPARILRIHISEGDKHAGKPLHEAILATCRELQVAGATVFRAVEGYGETAGIHKHHIIAHDQPLTVIVIDTPDNIARLTPVVETMLNTGVLAISDAEMIRVQR
jgi:PII-like signaling protein